MHKSMIFIALRNSSREEKKNELIFFCFFCFGYISKGMLFKFTPYTLQPETFNFCLQHAAHMNMNCSVGRYLKIYKHSALEMKRDER